MGTENKIITKVGPLGRQGLSSGVKPGFLKHRLLFLPLLACIAPFLLIPLLLLIFFFKLGFLCKTTHKVLDVFAAFSNNVCLSKLSFLTFMYLPRYMEGAHSRQVCEFIC